GSEDTYYIIIEIYRHTHEGAGGGRFPVVGQQVDLGTRIDFREYFRRSAERYLADDVVVERDLPPCIERFGFVGDFGFEYEFFLVEVHPEEQGRAGAYNRANHHEHPGNEEVKFLAWL